jgi:hypothetical protein
VKRVRKLEYHGTALFLLVLAATEAVFFRRWLGTALFVGATVFWWLLWPPYRKWSSSRSLRRFYSEGEPDTFFGPHSLTIDGDSLISRDCSEEGRVRLSSLQRVDVTSDHAFIYIDSVRAMIIPRQSVTDGDFLAFVSQLRKASNEAA